MTKTSEMGVMKKNTVSVSFILTFLFYILASFIYLIKRIRIYNTSLFNVFYFIIMFFFFFKFELNQNSKAFCCYFKKFFF
jgi:hypothetical protein